MSTFEDPHDLKAKAATVDQKEATNLFFFSILWDLCEALSVLCSPFLRVMWMMELFFFAQRIFLLYPIEAHSDLRLLMPLKTQLNLWCCTSEV